MKSAIFRVRQWHLSVVRFGRGDEGLPMLESFLEVFTRSLQELPIVGSASSFQGDGGAKLGSEVEAKVGPCLRRSSFKNDSALRWKVHRLQEAQSLVAVMFELLRQLQRRDLIERMVCRSIPFLNK